MKTRYRVLVQEKYSKWVDVLTEDPSLIEEEIAAMEEAGEIEWDPGEDFDSWDILEREEDSFLPSEIEHVQKWCKDMVQAVAIVDPDWVGLEMDEYQCQDWLEQMRDRGMYIPEAATSCDLWDAVEEYRKKEEIRNG